MSELWKGKARFRAHKLTSLYNNNVQENILLYPKITQIQSCLWEAFVVIFTERVRYEFLSAVVSQLHLQLLLLGTGQRCSGRHGTWQTHYCLMSSDSLQTLTAHLVICISQNILCPPCLHWFASKTCYLDGCLQGFWSDFSRLSSWCTQPADPPVSKQHQNQPHPPPTAISGILFGDINTGHSNTYFLSDL